MWRPPSLRIRIPRRASLASTFAQPRARAIAALAIVGTSLLATPAGTSGCESPVLAQLRTRQSASAFVEPRRDAAVLAQDDDAIASARAAFDDATSELSQAQALQAKANDVRARADEATAAAREYAHSPSTFGSDWTVTSAALDVDAAESQLESAQRLVATYEDMLAESQAGGYGDDSYQDWLDAARADVATARAALQEAKSSLADVQAGQAEAQRNQDTTRALAEQLEAEAEAAEEEAYAATSLASRTLNGLESTLDEAKARKAGHTAEHEREVAVAFGEHRAGSRSIAASNAAVDACRANTRLPFAGAGLVTVTAVAIGVKVPRASIGEQRRPTV